MTDTSEVLLECIKCHAIMQYPKPQEPNTHIFCPKCGHDFGDYGHMDEKIKSAIKLSDTPPGSAGSH